MPQLHFEMTISQRGLQKRYQGGHSGGLLWTRTPEMSATLKKRTLGGFGWKVRSSPSGGLAEYHWQREEPQRLLDAKWVGQRESDIPRNSVGCRHVSIEPTRRLSCFYRGECPIPWPLKHAGHRPVRGMESMLSVRSSSPTPFTLSVRISSIGFEKPCVPSVARE